MFKNFIVGSFTIRKRLDLLEKECKLMRVILESSVDIKSVSHFEGNYRTVQLIKAKMTELIAIIFEKNNITFWLDYGTLIGAIRHNGYIPWDDDIDIALLKEDYLKLPYVFRDLTKLNKGFLFDYANYGNVLYRFYYKYYYLCIDFFCFESTNKNYVDEEQKKDYVKKMKKCHYLIEKMFPYNDFFNKKVNCESIQPKVDQIKEKVFGYKYKEDSNSSQLIYSPEILADEKDYSLLSKKYIFPLKYERFENMLLPIPCDPISHLYEHGNYGEKGDVMKLPKITNYGYAHTQNHYDGPEERYKVL